MHGRHFCIHHYQLHDHLVRSKTPCHCLLTLDVYWASLAFQKSKSRRRKESEAKTEVLPKLTEDEKGDIVNQAVEALQDAIQQVCWVQMHRGQPSQQTCSCAFSSSCSCMSPRALH